MASWVLLTLHSLFDFLSPFITVAGYYSRFIRFPMLVMNFVTWALWWGVIAPGIYFYLPAKDKTGFVKFNTHFGLVNVHFLNLPFALISARVFNAPHGFLVADLWLALASAVCCKFLFFDIACALIF